MSRNQDKKEKKIETNCFVQCLYLDTNARVKIGGKIGKDGISLFFFKWIVYIQKNQSKLTKLGKKDQLFSKKIFWNNFI